MGAGKERPEVGEYRLPKRSRVNAECTTPPQSFHCRPWSQILDARGQWAAHANRHARFSAHIRRPPWRCPRPAGAFKRPRAALTQVLYQVHNGAFLHMPAQSCTRVKARASRPGCNSTRGKLGQTPTLAFRVSKVECRAAAPPGAPPALRYRALPPRLSRSGFLLLAPFPPSPSRTISCSLLTG